MRESFVFYRSYHEALRALPPELRLELYEAICSYALDDEISAMSDIAKAMFTLMKANIEATNRKYRSAIENGKRGGRPKKTEMKPKQNPIETETKPNRNLNDNVNDNENVTVNVNDNEDVTVTSTATAVSTAPTGFFEKTLSEEETGEAEEAEEGTQATEQAEDTKEEPVELLPLQDGKEYPVFPSDVKKWINSYSGLDITAELLRMKEWLDANPKKKKSPMNIRRFITGWLSHEWKEQKPPAYKRSASPSESNVDSDELWKNAVARSQEIMEELDRESRNRDQRT